MKKVGMQGRREERGASRREKRELGEKEDGVGKKGKGSWRKRGRRGRGM